MYDTLLSSILWYISWPILIIFSYQLVKWALKHFEKKAINKQ